MWGLLSNFWLTRLSVKQSDYRSLLRFWHIPRITFFYAKFPRFIREFDNDMLQIVMQSQVLKAAGLSLIDSSFTALDATPVKANVSNNNPKSFKSVKPDRQCIKTASFQTTVVRVRNTAVRLSVLKAVVAFAITNVGITARKTAVAQNTQLFPMITGFPLI